MIKNVTILGARESGFGAALLASKKGYNVFVSDINQIDDNVKLLFEENSIEYEENKHSIDKIQSSDLIIIMNVNVPVLRVDNMRAGKDCIFSFLVFSYCF